MRRMTPMELWVRLKTLAERGVHRPLLGIDFGIDKVGLAISDAHLQHAVPLCVIERTSNRMRKAHKRALASPLDAAAAPQLYGPAQTAAWHARLAKELSGVVEDEGVVGLVVGWPLHMDGRESAQCRTVDAFMRSLEHDHAALFPRTCLATVTEDERRTSKEAAAVAQQLQMAAQRHETDALAASIILQTALDSGRRLVGM